MQELPRDTEGYVDLERLTDADRSLDLSEWGSPPPLEEDTWQNIVVSAPHNDPASLGTDLDELVTHGAAEPSMIPGPWGEAEEAAGVDADADQWEPSWDSSSLDKDVDQGPHEASVHESQIPNEETIDEDDIGF